MSFSPKYTHSLYCIENVHINKKQIKEIIRKARLPGDLASAFCLCYSRSGHPSGLMPRLISCLIVRDIIGLHGSMISSLIKLPNGLPRGKSKGFDMSNISCLFLVGCATYQPSAWLSGVTWVPRACQVHRTCIILVLRRCITPSLSSWYFESYSSFKIM